MKIAVIDDEKYSREELIYQIRQILPDALDSGLTPVAVKEAVYQAADYLGYGRMLPFLNVTNELLEQRGIALPLEGQATTTPETRLEKGVEAQATIFGAHMREAWKAGDRKSVV